MAEMTAEELEAQFLEAEALLGSMSIDELVSGVPESKGLSAENKSSDIADEMIAAAEAMTAEQKEKLVALWHVRAGISDTFLRPSSCTHPREDRCRDSSPR